MVWLEIDTPNRPLATNRDARPAVLLAENGKSLALAENLVDTGYSLSIMYRFCCDGTQVISCPLAHSIDFEDFLPYLRDPHSFVSLFL